MENERGNGTFANLALLRSSGDDTEYQFDIVLNIDRDHIATASKDTTFLDKFGAVITPELGERLKAWLSDGVEPPKPPSCMVCGRMIRAGKKLSAAQIAEVTQKKTGQCMCMDCAKEWDEKQKEEPDHEAADVSE